MKAKNYRHLILTAAALAGLYAGASLLSGAEKNDAEKQPSRDTERKAGERDSDHDKSPQPKDACKGKADEKAEKDRSSDREDRPSKYDDNERGPAVGNGTKPPHKP